MSSLFMKLSFIHLIVFRVDNTRVFQRVSMDINRTVGQAACNRVARNFDGGRQEPRLNI